MSVCSQKSNSKQTCKEISGFILKVKKYNAGTTHISHGTLSPSHGVPFILFLIKEISILAGVKDPLLLVWCLWKDQKDVVPVDHQLSSLG